MGISKAQWAVIEEKLQGWFAEISFEYEGHEIRCQKRSLSENRMVICVFIDGEIKYSKAFDHKGEGFDPLVEKFWSRHFKYVYSNKMRESLRRLNKVMKRGEKYSPDEKRIYYRPYFSTARSLVRQFRKIDGLQLKEG